MHRKEMYHSVYSVALSGMDGVPVRVEADVRDGFPSFEMMGYLSGQVREAGGRVKSALHNSGFSLEPKRICINLAPATVKKEGNAFDLPIAIAILTSMIPLSKHNLDDIMFVGELGLDGSVRRIPGILPMVWTAREAGLCRCVVPKENVEEASVLSGIQVCGVSSLKEVVHLLQGEWEAEENARSKKPHQVRQMESGISDFADVNGQQGMKRAIEVAVSGRHNLLMVGSAGSGKTLLARCIPGIMPEMKEEEKMEVSRLYSAAGLLDAEHVLVEERPFRAPHHSITRAALMGGGQIPKAGEISLAHRGVLFLDELPEFRPETIEALRQPMEERCIVLTRAYGAIRYPADFLVVAAMNPCRCGYYPDRNRCHCNEAQVKKYLHRVSGPIRDRMDLVASVQPVSWESFEGKENPVESSAQVRRRIEHVWKIQKERYGGNFNGQMTRSQIDTFCKLEKREKLLMKEAFDRLGISARAYHKILKMARTIADMAESERIAEEHLSEAIRYRSTIRQWWE